MFDNLVMLLKQRIILSISTLPNLGDWIITSILLGIYTLIALPVGFRTQLLKLEVVKHWQTISTTIIVALIFPSIFEEILFRVLLLPRTIEHAPIQIVILWSAFCLTIFVLAHPLNARIFFPARRATFYDRTFLFLAGLLGTICTISYLQSGSVWPPIFLHWIIVIIWLLCLGGEQKMASNQ